MNDPRNVVLVTVDSLRADHCGFVGEDLGLTPGMDEMAAAGLVFETAIAPGPSTLDSMPTVFTGADIPDAEVPSDLDRRERFRHHLRARDTIPERLSREGYATAGFSANPWTSRAFGFDRGFDRFEDYLDGEAVGGAVHSESTITHAVRLARNWRSSNMLIDCESIFEDARDWIDRTSEPYFLWLFLVDVHMPYLPSKAYRRGTGVSAYLSNLWLYLRAHETPTLESVFRRPLVRAYEDTIRYTDAALERFVGELADDPLVVVHADHGEGLGDHGDYGHGPHLYRENVHVPLFVANGPTGRVEEPFSLGRLPELLVRLARRESVEELTEPVVRARNHDPKFAARGRDWKYIECPDGSELYDLTQGEFDQIEDADLAEQGRAAVARWRGDERERRAVGAALDAVVDEHAI